MSNPAKAFKEMIAEEAGKLPLIRSKGMDLFLYNRMEGTIWGCDGEFILSARVLTTFSVHSHPRWLC